MLSTMVHAVFGYSLMGAGLARLVEVCFVARECNPQADEDSLSPFMHLPPFLLIASGFIFMAATEEQLAFVDGAGVDHISYILLLYSMAFLMYLSTPPPPPSPAWRSWLTRAQ